VNCDVIFKTRIADVFLDIVKMQLVVFVVVF